MRLHEEFQVNESVGAVWRFLDAPQQVAACMPGVEQVRLVDADHVDVRATQSIGPLSATFDAQVTVLERVPNELIRFQASGKSIRGAAGHIRTTSEVRLVEVDGATKLLFDGDVVLAGTLGSVGQKIVAKQAGKVTAAFAENLRRALNGETLARPAPSPLPAPATPLGQRGPGDGGGDRIDVWSKVAAAMSTLSAVLSLVAVVRTRRRSR